MRHQWLEYVGRDLRIIRTRERADTRRGGGVPEGTMQGEHVLEPERGEAGGSSGRGQGPGPCCGQGLILGPEKWVVVLPEDH